MHNNISTHLLGYLHTDPPENIFYVHTEIYLPVYLHTSSLSNNKDLHVTTNTCVPAHRCTFSLPYLFIFILYFRLNAKIYPSTFLQHCMTLFIFMFLFLLTTKTYLLLHVIMYLPKYMYIPVRELHVHFHTSIHINR